MSAKHTPGPWEASGWRVCFNCGLGQNIGVICDTATRKADRTLENMANARLIAAAPDLLEACKALQMEAAARGCGLRIADEAIAKAEKLERVLGR